MFFDGGGYKSRAGCHGMRTVPVLKQLILGLKKNFSITIFHEKKLPFSVAPFILPLKHSNRAFEALPWLQKAIWQK